jgi:hypothetical protein
MNDDRNKNYFSNTLPFLCPLYMWDLFFSDYFLYIN